MKRLLMLLAAVLVLAGCGDAAAADGPRDITVTIAAGQVTPAPDRIEVAKGQTVTITATSDVADMLHVHGYDKAATLYPGQAGTVEFVADTEGLFEVETHAQELQLFQLVVR